MCRQNQALIWASSTGEIRNACTHNQHVLCAHVDEGDIGTRPPHDKETANQVSHSGVWASLYLLSCMLITKNFDEEWMQSSTASVGILVI